MDRDQLVSFSVGILAGAAVGGLVALLFAPQSGRATREFIQDKFGDVRETMGGKIADVRQAVGGKIAG